MPYIWENGRKKKIERRKVIRTKASMRIDLDDNGRILSGKTLDICYLGASCIVMSSFPEFSRVNATIKFPLKNELNKPININVPVIIVNCRKVPKARKQYRLGFYYDDLTKEFQVNTKILIKQFKKKLRKEKQSAKTEE